MKNLSHDPEKDRRPIAARGLRVFQRLAAWMAARRVSPNAISMAGMFFGIGAGLSLAATARWPEWERVFWIAAAGLVQMRLLANLLDGMVAIASGRASRVGELYNEAPDRVSDAATLAGLGYVAGSAPWLGFVAALCAVITAYVRTLGKAAGAANDFRGPMAKQQRMALVTAVAVYMGAAPAAWRPVWGDGWGLPGVVLAVIVAGCVVTVVRRLRAIASTLGEAPA